MGQNLKTDLITARAFLQNIDLPVPSTRALATGPTPGFVPDEAKEQVVIAGADIVSFARGVTAERRKAITHSALLAQLVASQQVKDPEHVEDWYRAYFDVLTNIGWPVQQRGFSTFETASDQAEVHQAVLEIAKGLVGGAAASAYKLIKLSLDALKKLDEGSPWITLFHRESLHAKTARFQITLADKGPNEDFLVTLMAFSLQASSSIKQILVFKFRSERATLKHYSGSMSVDDGVLLGIAPDITEKVRAYIQGYIKALPDLEPVAT